MKVNKQDLPYCDYITTVHCRARKGTTTTFSFSYSFLFFLEFLVAFSLYSLFSSTSTSSQLHCQVFFISETYCPGSSILLHKCVLVVGLYTVNIWDLASFRGWTHYFIPDSLVLHLYFALAHPQITPPPQKKKEEVNFLSFPWLN